MGRKKQEEEAALGAPEWVVTFSDMISLLVTFFVMLMSFSTIDDNEAAIIVGAFGQNTGGIIDPGPNSPISPAKDRMLASNPIRGALQPHARPPEELPDNLQDMGQKATDEHVQVDFAEVADGLLVTFDARSSFAPGSAEVNAMLHKSLVDIADVLQHYGHLVVIEGFTDDAFVPTLRYPNAEALSAARAVNAAQVMLDSSQMSRDLLQIAGLGSTRPIAPNDTATGRTLNRRVQLRILALSNSRARALQDAYQKQRAEEGR